MDKRFCIFDMDGTLVDSMHYWKGLGRDYLESLGIHPDERLLWMWCPPSLPSPTRARPQSACGPWRRS